MVQGNILASNCVDIRGKGILQGDITAMRLRIEDGAHFRGRIDLSHFGEESQDNLHAEENVRGVVEAHKFA
jgi:cytoskeletal protein CcmA (bactofilin family)